MASLTASFESERDRASVRVREAIAPYEHPRYWARNSR